MPSESRHYPAIVGDAPSPAFEEIRMRLSHLWDLRRPLSCCLVLAVAIALAISGCAAPAAANESASATATSVPTVTPTPQPPCTQLVAGATPLQSVSGV